VINLQWLSDISSYNSIELEKNKKLIKISELITPETGFLKPTSDMMQKLS